MAFPHTRGASTVAISWHCACKLLRLLAFRPPQSSCSGSASPIGDMYVCKYICTHIFHRPSVPTSTSSLVRRPHTNGPNPPDTVCTHLPRPTRETQGPGSHPPRLTPLRNHNQRTRLDYLGDFGERVRLGVKGKGREGKDPGPGGGRSALEKRPISSLGWSYFDAWGWRRGVDYGVVDARDEPRAGVVVACG